MAGAMTGAREGGASECPASIDIAIIGGGGMGSACAYWLKLMGPPELAVTVFEADPGYARAATTLAAGGIRQQFSTPENILMSQFGFEFLTGAAQALGVEGHDVDLGVHQTPYLHLASGDDLAGLRASFDLQASLGSAPEWLDQSALAGRFPWLRTDDVEAAVLGGPREGTFDPPGLLAAMRRKAIALGARYVAGEVEGIELGADGRVAAIRCNAARIACGRAINAAGPAAGRVAAMAGVDLPIIPVRAHTFVFRAEQPLPGPVPIVVDQVQLLNFRAEGPTFLAGTPREGGLDDAGDDFAIDYDLFESLIWPMLAARVPAFEAIRFAGAWVGHMEWSRLDANPIVGPHPEIDNFMFVAGFSGHGAQHIPAAGRAIAELVLDGGYRSIDLSRFGYERVRAGAPYPELF